MDITVNSGGFFPLKTTGGARRNEITARLIFRLKDDYLTKLYVYRWVITVIELAK